jgi:hypothetical protein
MERPLRETPHSRIDTKQSFVIWEELFPFAHLLPDPLQFDTSVIEALFGRRDGKSSGQGKEE